MKKSFMVILVGIVLSLSISGCKTEQENNMEKSEWEESGNYVESDASRNSVLQEGEDVSQGVSYHEDGTITLPEGSIACGFYHTETGEIYDEGTVYEINDGKIKGRVSFQQNYPETRHYLFIAMIDYVQQEFVMEGKTYTEYAFELTGETETNFNIELHVPDTVVHEFSYIIFPKPEEKEFIRDGIYQEVAFELQRNYVYRLNLSNTSESRAAKAPEGDNTIEIVDITEAEIPDGFVLSPKHDATKYEIKTVVEGSSGETYELVIGNEDGEEEKEYAIVAFLNWEQIPLLDGKEVGYVKVPAGKQYMILITLPEVERESVYQICAFRDPYGKLTRENLGRDESTLRVLVNSRKK